MTEPEKRKRVIGDDGEFLLLTALDKPKRKLGESPKGSRLRWILLALVIIALGIAVFILRPRLGTTLPASITSTSKILFLASTDKFITSSNLYVANADGSQVTKLPMPPDIKVFDPAWSPDGKQIAFVSSQGQQTPKIYLMGADGAGLRKLTKDDLSSESSPTWSPDEQKIAYEAYGANYTLQIISVDVSETSELLPANLDNKNHPVWSPDGKYIAFIDAKQSQELWLVAPDGSAPHRLASGQVNDDFSWSPDAQQIAFTSNRNGKQAIFVIDVNGSNLTQITDNQSNNWCPNWSSDGKRIAFTSDRTGSFKIYTMSPSGADVARVTMDDFDEQCPVWSK